MNIAIDQALHRWLSAGLIDSTTEQRIRDFEAAEPRHTGARWQVILALAFGAMLLTAGIALFVAAHWAALSPWWRFAVVLLLTVISHLIAMAVRRQFGWLAIALHGVGTVAAGCAVFLTGQIFNIREDWPAGVLLSLLCAAAGWLLLHDQVQQLLSLLLLPAWILCEWNYRTGSYSWSGVYEFRLLGIFAAVLMTVFLGSRRRLVATILLIASTVALYIALLASAFSQEGVGNASSLPLGWRVAGWAMIVLCAVAGILARRTTILPSAATLAILLALPWCQTAHHYATWTNYEPSPLAYALIGVFSALLAWYGVRRSSPGLINVGILYFAATVIWFYFSDVMGKLNRSFSLMVLGALLLLGGWLLERMRRRLIAGLTGRSGLDEEVRA